MLLATMQTPLGELRGLRRAELLLSLEIFHIAVLMETGFVAIFDASFTLAEGILEKSPLSLDPHGRKVFLGCC